MNPTPGLSPPPDLLALMEVTWPPAERRRAGPFTLRRSPGGGSRVTAATADAAAAIAAGDIDAAEAGMAEFGQRPLFMIRSGDAALDALLVARGYALFDPVVVYAAAIATLGPPPDPLAAFPHWPPLQITRLLWAEGGVGADRMAVMDRAAAPKAAILGRNRDRPAGAAFVACAGPGAFLHALEVTEASRRHGAGRALVCAAAQWAGENGADWLALAVTRANAPARSLYASLGMQAVEQYHYRIPPA